MALSTPGAGAVHHITSGPRRRCSKISKLDGLRERRMAREGAAALHPMENFSRSLVSGAGYIGVPDLRRGSILKVGPKPTLAKSMRSVRRNLLHGPRKGSSLFPCSDFRR
jgi:hypothetical protein